MRTPRRHRGAAAPRAARRVPQKPQTCARGSESHEEQYPRKHPTHETTGHTHEQGRAAARDHPPKLKRPIPPRVALREEP